MDLVRAGTLSDATVARWPSILLNSASATAKWCNETSEMKTRWRNPMGAISYLQATLAAVRNALASRACYQPFTSPTQLATRRIVALHKVTACVARVIICLRGNGAIETEKRFTALHKRPQ
jgi:hypothetical protein